MNKIAYGGILALAATASCQATDSRPNILLVLTDDHSFPHLGIYGNENCLANNITPHMDAFAADAVLFNKAYVTAPHSAPSRVSLFTGQHPVVTGTTRFGQPPQVGIPYFTDLLRQSGYWVGLTGRSHHLDGYYHGTKCKAYRELCTELGFTGPKFNERFEYIKFASTYDKNLPFVGQHLNHVLDSVGADKPFFLYYGTNQPHTPWPKTHPNVNKENLILPLDWEDTPDMRTRYARYLQAVKEADNAFGQMLQTLKDRGEYDNTIIILMGDNGESLPRGKCTLYDRGTHVPFIVRVPGHSRAGYVSDALISSIDISATLLEIAGIKPTPTMQGISFLPELKGEVGAQPRQYAFAEVGWHFKLLGVDPDDMYFARSVNDGRYLLIYSGVPRPGMEYFEMFDLQSDPFQLNNLFLSNESEHRAKRLELIKAINRRMILDGDFMSPPSEFIKVEAGQGRYLLGSPDATL